MAVRNFYQPIAPTKWDEELGPIYERQTNQLAEHHANLRERDRQMVEAEKGVEPVVKVIEGVGTLAKFSKQIASAVDAARKAKLKKEWNEKSASQKFAIRNDYKFRAEGLKFEDTSRLETYGAALRNAGHEEDSDFYKEVMREAAALTGSEHLKYMELSSRDELSLMSRDAIEAGIQHDGGWETYQKLDPIGKEAQQRSWVKGRLKELGYSDGIIESLDLEIERKVLTTTNVSKNAANVKAQTGRVNRFNERFASADITSGTDLAQFAHSEIRNNMLLFSDDSAKGGLTAKQKATQEFLNNLSQLGRSRRFSRASFELLVNGEVKDYKTVNGKTVAVDTGIGKTFKDVYLGGKALEGWEERVLEGIEAGENMTYTQLQGLGEQSYASYYQQAERGNLKFGTTEYNNAMIRLRSLPLKNRDKKIEELELIANNDQSKEETQRVLTNYAERIKQGTLTASKEEIKKIPNIAARNILLQMEEDQFNAIKAVDFKGDHFDGTISKGKTGPFALAGATDATKSVQQDVQRYFRGLYFQKVSEAKARGETPNYQRLLEESKIETRTYMADNGFGVAPDHPNAGKFSVDGVEGDYTNYTDNYSVTKFNYQELYDVKYNPTNVKKWDLNFENNKNRGNFKKAGAIFSREMLAGYVETGRPSPEMLYIASKYPKHNISKLLGYSIDAVLNSKDPKDVAFKGNFNISKLNTKQLPEQILIEGAEQTLESLKQQPKGNEAKIQDLNTLRLKAQRSGFDSLSSNEIQRWISYSELFPNPALIEKAEKEKREEDFINKTKEMINNEKYRGPGVNLNPNIG